MGFSDRTNRGGLFQNGLILAGLFVIISILLSCHPNNVNGDYNVNCKTKFRNMWLRYCAGDSDVRGKRESVQTEPEQGNQDPKIPPPNPGADKRLFSRQDATELFDFAAPIIARLLNVSNPEIKNQGNAGPWSKEFPERPRVAEIAPSPSESRFGFSAPKSGDDLGMGMGRLSYADVEDLWKEMVERLPRAAKNKDETIKMITGYAAKCCNENFDDTSCSNPADVINCP